MQTTKVPSHIYMLIVLLGIAGAAGIVVYNETQTAALMDNPKLAQKVVASNAFKGSISKAVSNSLAETDLEDLLSDSDAMQSLISDTVANQLAGYASTNTFQEAVTRALSNQSKIVDSSDRLTQIQAKMNLYESQLADIAAEVNDDESAETVNELQGNLVELQKLIGNLSDEVHCSLALATGTKSSFLLKERRSTQLPGMDLVITLGRIKKDVIQTVTISAPNADRTQGDTQVVGGVKLGTRLEFQSGGRNFEGLFTYKQARLGPDFVGFEVTEVITPPEGCRESAPPAAAL